MAGTLNELNKSYEELLNDMKGTIKGVETAKKLWREGNKSKLIRIGLTLIVLPEPTPISESIGTCFIAAGAIQKAIRNRAIYIEDINKTLQKTLKEVQIAKQNLRI
jgi:hypothetical protein